MSGAVLFVGIVSQFANKAALGAAMVYGGGGAALPEMSGAIHSPNFEPSSHVSDVDADINSASAEDVVASTAEPEGSETLDGDAGPIADDLPRGGLTLSGGYSAVEGPNVEVKIARLNINGADREASATARYSKIQTLFELGYADGKFLGSRLTFAPTLFANQLSARGFGSDLQSTPFRQTARGVNFHFNRKFDIGLSASANYRLSADEFRLRDRKAVCDIAVFGSPICTALGKTTSSVLSIALAFDRRNNTSGVIRGYKLRLTQDLAGLGGSTKYSRSRIGGEAHFGVGDGWSLALDAEAGYLAPFGGKPVPLFDRFYIGDTSMRGFDLRGIGPKIRPAAAAANQNVAIGGSAYYVARAELSLPIGGGIIGNRGLQAHAFVDAGSVFGVRKVILHPGESLLGNSAKPRVAVGVGISFNTPAGKLRLDIAQAVVKQIGDRTKNFSISFGAGF